MSRAACRTCKCPRVDGWLPRPFGSRLSADATRARPGSKNDCFWPSQRHPRESGSIGQTLVLPRHGQDSRRGARNDDGKTLLWSFTVRNASRATGPTKVGGTGREHTSSNRRLPLLMTMRAGLASPCCTSSLRLGTTALRFASFLVSLRHGQPD